MSVYRKQCRKIVMTMITQPGKVLLFKKPQTLDICIEGEIM